MRHKPQQLDLFADGTSTAPFASNQLRLWFSTSAYLILARLRAVALHGTVLARATVGTIRLRLLKVAAMITVSVRRVHVRLAGAFPLQETFRLVHQRLMTWHCFKRPLGRGRRGKDREPRETCSLRRKITQKMTG